MSELNMSWQVGDSVRCVHADCCEGRFKAGTVYQIAGLPSVSYLQVDGVFGSWDRDRFELVGTAADPKPDPIADPNSYADWKSGDSVRCLNASASWGMLAEQHVYEIDGNLVWRDDCGPGIHLVGIPSHEWDCSRFERVAPIVDVHSEPDKPVVRVGSRVRCDSASGTGASLGEGNVYTVASVQPHGSDTFLRLNDCSGMGWDISRFTILPDEVAPSVPLPHADQSDVELMHADEARRLADEHFMANGLELRLAIKYAIAAAVAKGESIAHVHISDSVFPAAVRWISKRGYSMSMVPGFTRGTISWE